MAADLNQEWYLISASGPVEGEQSPIVCTAHLLHAITYLLHHTHFNTAQSCGQETPRRWFPSPLN